MNIVGFYYTAKLRLLYERLSRKVVKAIQRAEDISAFEANLKIADDLIEKGDMYMCCFIALTYFDESKSWYDVEKAVHYFEIAANNGNSDAQWHLGMIHYLGMSETGMNPVLGGYWMRQSAEQGNKYALRFLRMQNEGFSPNV